MERLCGLLADDTGEVTVRLDFGIDEEGIRRVSGRLTAELRLVCQGCLEPMTYTVEASVSLAVVGNEAQAEQLPERYEPLMTEAQEPLFLQDIVEDELILALPIVARHPQGQCAATGAVGGVNANAGEDGPRENPFAVLAGLKKMAKPKED